MTVHKHMNTFSRIALLISLLCFFNEALAQDSLQPAIREKKRLDKDPYQKSYPTIATNLKKMDKNLHELVHQMKATGLTRENAISRHAEKLFSTNKIHVDSLGRLHVVLHLQDLSLSEVYQLRRWGTRFMVYCSPTEGDKSPAYIFFKMKKIPLLKNNSGDKGELDCCIPFDSIEKIAHFPSLISANPYLFNLPIDHSTNGSVDTISGLMERENSLDSSQIQHGTAFPKMSLDSIVHRIGRIPTYHNKLTDPLHNLITLVRDNGLTPDDLKSKSSHNRILREDICFDTLGRLRIRIYLRGIDRVTMDMLAIIHARIDGGWYDPYSTDTELTDELNMYGVDAPGTAGNCLYCYVSLDSIERLRKLKSVWMIGFPEWAQTVEGF